MRTSCPRDSRSSSACRQPRWQGNRHVRRRRAEAYYEFLLGRHLESEGAIDKAIAAYDVRACSTRDRPNRRPNWPALYARQGRFGEARTLAEAALAIDDANERGPSRARQRVCDAGRQRRQGRRRSRRPTPPAGRSTTSSAAAAAGPTGPGHRPHPRPALPQRQPSRGRRARVATAARRRARLARGRRSAGAGRDRAGRTRACRRRARSGRQRQPPAAGHLAELYQRQQRWPDAAATYARLSALAPGSHDTRIRWATALLQSDDAEAPAQARRAFVPTCSI